MNLYEILVLTLTGVSSILGWFARQMWSAVKDLQADLANLKEGINQNFVRKDDYKDFKTEIINLLHRIEDKLDGKVDR
jgi:hypothetical protein